MVYKAVQKKQVQKTLSKLLTYLLTLIFQLCLINKTEVKYIETKRIPFLLFLKRNYGENQ